VKSSYQQSLARRISLQGAYKEKLERLKETLALEIVEEEQEKLKGEILQLEKLVRTIPFFDDVDLRYNYYEQVPVPTSSAVMFCIMDVSASMGYHEKDIAKRFFTLLYIFLTKQYTNVELVFIRHHTVAKEVGEEEFFNSRESGGTVVAPSLTLMQKIMKERYNPDQWNVYCCQATDGDVWSDRDALECGQILAKDILPYIQYMAYVEINDHDLEGALWQVYSKLRDEQKFSMRNLYDVNQIWPVFRGLFKKNKIEVPA
jgi:uncharacterized sporulation protein YeaH/YhbH (DUF444 family)